MGGFSAIVHGVHVAAQFESNFHGFEGLGFGSRIFTW
jgi:hypothetical protein